VLRNLKLVIEFDGTAYAGWQFQPDRPTIQGAVESALRRITRQETTVYGCGRTDAGVSARRYVANVREDTSLPLERIRAALNHFLPTDIHIHGVDEVAAGFHARFSAKRKTYAYRIVRGTSPLRRRHAWEYLYPLDVERTRWAAASFAGRRDFQPFCQTRNANGICTVESIAVASTGDELTVKVSGDRFLYKMVRRMVGAVVACGSGRLTQKDIRSALAGRPSRPFTTAPACGLLLDSVDY
jgi:tRNA pseudouridine38-40 synthase